MSKRIRKSRWSTVEFYFPELVIQRIQSFLTSRQAAQTTILSKSWRSVWLTRPNLDFHHADYCGCDHVEKLNPKFFKFGMNTLEMYENLNLNIFKFAMNTLERYENSNLNIESFSLRICFNYGFRNIYNSCTGPAVKNLVCSALKLGPTRVNLELHSSDFEIPDEVFRYDNLVSLTVGGCKIFNLNREVVCCSRLQFLSFKSVRIKRLDTIFHIMSSCPLIEKLSLCNVYVSDPYVVGDDGLLTITTPLHRLKSLVLKDVKFDTTLFLDDLSSLFPSLQELAVCIKYSTDREDILISSPTLERLHFNMTVCNWVRKVKFDVPSICKLTFKCSSTIPDELSVQSNSRGWESCVSVEYCTCLSASWFYKLSSFLDKLRLSRISLSFHVDSQTTFDYEGGEIRGLPTPEIENLNIYHEHLPTLSCYALFDGLFRMCHPKAITQYMRTLTEEELLSSWRTPHPETKHFNFLLKRLLEAREAKIPLPNQLMYGLNDLKEARAQVFDRAVSAWRDVTLESLLDVSYDDSTHVRESPVCRFLLNWKQ